MSAERQTWGPGGVRVSIALGLTWLLAALVVGCVSDRGARTEPVEPIRVSDAEGLGDPARRASVRLILQGLDADAVGNFDRAQGSYERAIQVDATNPYAYLALARHHLDGEEAENAELLIDQAAALFEAEGMREPRVGVHLMGLRGQVMLREGYEEDAALYLERARSLAPEVWRDGRLSPEELR